MLNYQIRTWRWDMPELMVVWIYNRINRNIVIFVNYDNYKVELECNAWVDIRGTYKGILENRRKWANIKIGTLLIPDKFVLTTKFIEEYILKIESTFNEVNSLKISNLEKESILPL